MKRIDLAFNTVDPQNEVNLMKVLNHPNIIKYYDSYEHHEKLYIIMEYAKNCTNLLIISRFVCLYKD